MSNITEKIDSIIQVRKGRVKLIEEALEKLKKTDDCISMIKRIKDDLHSPNSKYLSLLGSAEAAAKIQSISLDDFYKLSSIYRAKLQQLYTRFNRDSLHISFVGSARQGKSLVIQNISGLDKSIIPSSDGSDCTGAKSIITNSDDEAVNARITFYSANEMIDIINNYLEKITHGKKHNINSVDDIPSIPIEQIKKDIGTYAEEQGYANHLRNYINHFSEICDLFGQTITVPKEDIEKYVAQYKHDNFSEKYWNYLGVKLADIHCRFPYSDSGKIVLLDTIGIGTTSLGVESSMLDTVENDSDAIIFMFRPDPLGPKVSSTETKIISMISERVSHEYAKEMLFWVINKVEDGKGRNVDYISGVIDQIELSDLPVSAVLPVNCLSREAVENELLSVVLEKMSSKIDVVDSLLVTRTNEAGTELYNEFIRIANAFERGRISGTVGNLSREMLPIRDRTINKLFNQLRELYITTYKKRRDEACSELKEATSKTLDSMFSFVPSESDIIELLNMGTINQHNAMENCTDKMRLDIIDAFMDLDRTLEVLVDNMKKEVLTVFTSEEYGHLSTIEDDISDPCDWIDRFVDKIGRDDDYPVISEALLRFKDFSCSVQGFMIFEVRAKLDNIDFELRRNTPKLIHDLSDKQRLAKEIHEKLLNELEPVHNDIEIALDSLYKIPNRAMFAAIKDLYDRAIKEDREKKTKISAKDEWRYLYEKWTPVIWSEEYKRAISSQTMAVEFNSVIDSIKNCSNKGFYEVKI